MSGNWRTTVIGVLVLVVALGSQAINYLHGAPLDFASIGSGLLGLLTALGFIKAADAANSGK